MITDSSPKKGRKSGNLVALAATINGLVIRTIGYSVGESAVPS
jgi:hypothetical protein